MEDANLIVRVDIEPKKQKVSKGAKAAPCCTILGSFVDHPWAKCGQVAKLRTDRTDSNRFERIRTISKFQICQAIENLMSKSDREVLEAPFWRVRVSARPWPMAIAHGSRRTAAQAMAQEGWEATAMCCALEILG